MPNTRSASTKPEFDMVVESASSTSSSSSCVSEPELARPETQRPSRSARRTDSIRAQRARSNDRVLNNEPQSTGRPAQPRMEAPDELLTSEDRRHDLFRQLGLEDLRHAERLAIIEELRRLENDLLRQFGDLEANMRNGDFSVTIITKSGRTFEMGDDKLVIPE
ncbi:Oidioi.mRNA.OKI2018_I69.chr1.g2758.t1.cds [Oikopleura dioica]|uniref:Oidioi.mRNA.OKI2018_I69.chr1.g2758.t1.cds n=1 Tax=Oikopleura dioica TaxID=34765 RepID=A0ABN7SWF1_OIKDI|nr:Oidioi.mRNA.OKI2018_I69.chr1.g2758.t1.cds [Oikopleura dioica]